ncbi:hypothetical protein SO802_002520 [Lithocarpus litseifolius]|uniref:Uncharacterized protein n=1 Tax=Lithocarpus litseifolius TaxID=425828 RepID=A0AAW2E2T8_9ROSI
MSKIIVSSSSDRDKGEIDEYHDESNSSGSTSESNSSESSSSNEHYSFRVPLEVLQDPFPPYTGEMGHLRPKALRRPSLSKFYLDCVQLACFFTGRTFHFLVILCRLATWGLRPDPTEEALSHKLTTRRRMATMKENKGKGVVANEVTQFGDKDIAQTRPPISSIAKFVLSTSLEKRKMVSKSLDTSNLPNRQGNKKQKVDSSTPSTIHVMALDHAALGAKPKVNASLTCPDVDPSKPSPVGPLDSGPMTFLKSEGLVWDNFKQVSFGPRRCHLLRHKQNDELWCSLSKSRDEVIREFKTSKEYTDHLDENYAAGFEDFRMDAIESFPGVDFDFIKLRTTVESSLLQMSLEDVNIEDDASTPHPTNDDPKFGDDVPCGLS